MRNNRSTSARAGKEGIDMDFIAVAKGFLMEHSMPVGMPWRVLAGVGLAALLVFHETIRFRTVVSVVEERWRKSNKCLLDIWIVSAIINKILLMTGYGVPGITAFTSVTLMSAWIVIIYSSTIIRYSEFSWYWKEICTGAFIVFVLTDYLWIWILI